MKKKGYAIKDLEVLSGIKAHTIRIWEKRYNLLEPSRTDTNIRYYSDEDLRRLLNISMLVRNGFKISKIANMDDKTIRSTILEINQKYSSEAEYINRLILHMADFDNRSFLMLSDEIIKKMGLESAVTKVFFEFFTRVGTYWQVGSIFPAQEHYVTHIFSQKVLAEIDKLPVPDEKSPTMLMYLPENEHHELSLLFYAYLAQKAGINVIYLGASVPWSDLVNIHSQVKLDYVFTAFINGIKQDDLGNYVGSMKSLFRKQKVFITGGQLKDFYYKLPRYMKMIKDYQEFLQFLEK